MYERQVPIGKLEATIAGFVSPTYPDFRAIPANGVLLEVGETVWTKMTNCPIVFAAARKFMIVAHSGGDIVATIFKTLSGRGVLVGEIVMCMHCISSELESEYHAQAARIGIQYIWTVSDDCPPKDHNLILIKRTA